MVDTWDAPDDIFSGNLYVELPGERHWERDDRTKLLASCVDLTRRYPAIGEAARNANVRVEQFLLDTMFTNLLPAQLSLAKLTFPRGTRAVDIDVAVRLAGDARPNWPLPKGVSLVAKARWNLQGTDRQTDDVYTNKNPALRIWSFHDGPPGEARSFEVSLNVECRQTARLEPGARKVHNVLTQRLAEALPAISDLTRERLKDWSDFLDWKRRLIRANRESLRYTARAIGPDQRSVVFTTIGPSEESLRQAIGRLSRSDMLSAFETSLSEDEWVFQLPEGEREPRGGDIGRMTGGRAKTEAATQADESPWPSPVTAYVSFSLSDDALAAIESSEDTSGAVERALRRVPDSGFIVQSAIQDMSQVDRQHRALRDLSDQGGYSPYLARHIFDAAEARIPSTLTWTDDWINTHLNTAQRSAVQKVLSAPDLCLIQGPPGTGKTTVIAEAIAQMARRNETVLLASQTHTAVDNALSKLPFHPSIRAVRLTRNIDRLSDDGKEFVNERALGRYYNSLANAAEAHREEAQSEARFAEHFTRIQATATRLVDDLAESEGRVQELTATAATAADRYIGLGQQLRASGIQVPSFGNGSQMPPLPDLDQSIEVLRSSLPRVTAQMESLVAERPLPSANSNCGRRSELTAQLAEVLERMKGDASVVSEYQRLQAELAELGEEAPIEAPSVNALQTYFPDAAWLLDEPGKSLMALLQKRKRAKAAKDVLRRIDLAKALIPQLDQASAVCR